MRYLSRVVQFCLCIGLAALACCGPASGGPAMPAPPKRIVSLSPAVTEILYELGLGDRVVADTAFCNYPADAMNKEKVGDFFTVNEEKIVWLEADLVIDTTSMAHKAMWRRLNRAGIPVVDFDVNTMEGVYSAYIGIGKAAGVEEKARELVGSLKGQLAAIKYRCASAATKPRVMFFVEYPNLTVVGKGTFIDRLITDAGCENAVTQAGWQQNFPKELVAEMKPDIIIHAVDGSLLTARYAKEIRDSWADAANVPAVAEGRIFIVNGDTATRPGPRIVIGWSEIARLVHPELYEQE